MDNNVKISLGIDTSQWSADYKKLEQLNSSAARKMAQELVRALGSAEPAIRGIVESLIRENRILSDQDLLIRKTVASLKDRLAIEKRLEQSAANQRKLAQANSRLNIMDTPGFVSAERLRASGMGLPQRAVGPYGPFLTGQQRRAIGFENQKRDLEQFGNQLSSVFGKVVADVKAKASLPFVSSDVLLASGMQQLAARDDRRFRAGLSNVGTDWGYYYGSGGGRGGRGGGPLFGGRGGYRDIYADTDRSGRRQAMIQQGIFAIDDFVTSLGTGGFSGAVRGASNNITALAAMMGPWALGIGVALTSVVQLTLAFTDLEDIMDRDKKRAEELANAEEKLGDARRKQSDLLASIVDEMSGAGYSETAARRRKQEERSAELAETSRETLRRERDVARQRLTGSGRTVTEQDVTNATTATGLRNRMAGFGMSGMTYDTDATSLRGQQQILRAAEGLSAEDRARAGITADILATARSTYEASTSLALSGSLPVLDEAAFARGQARGLLDQYGGESRFGAQLDDITFVMDDATTKLKDGRIAWEQYVEIADDAIARQNELNMEIGKFVREQEQQAAFYGRRKGALDAFLSTAGGEWAAQRQRDEMNEFIRGARLAGVEQAEAERLARERFGLEPQVVGEEGILSKAALGMESLRQSNELVRLLSGDDSSRRLVTINEEQLREQREQTRILGEVSEHQFAVAD